MRQAPLLFYGLCFLLGIATQILFHPAYPLIVALLIFFLRERLVSGILIYGAGFAFAALSMTLPTLPEEGIEGHGTFIPESVSYGHSPFGTSFITKGSLNFTTSKAKWNRIPCRIYTPLHKPRPPGNCALTIEGRLLPKTFPTYVLKPSHVEPNPVI
ncbi:MAG: hypothetical protein ACRDFB_10890, partial [Rhabdochlamydiaceae bacterium]